jgi:phytanoyl-CoA hydroxylase
VVLVSDNRIAEFVHRFNEEGWTLLGKVASDEEIEALSERIDASMDGEVRYDELEMQLDPSAFADGSDERQNWRGGSTVAFLGATRAYRKISRLELDPLFRAFMQKPLFAELARAIIGDAATVPRAMFMNKPAWGGTDLAWHQDFVERAYQFPAPPPITIWTAIDPATRANGCVQIVPGTHRRRLGSGPAGFLTEDEAGLLCPAESRVFIELAAGEAVLLHSWTLHKSDPNSTGIPRRGYSFSLGPGDARYEGRSPFPRILPDYVPATVR